jgi:hypothetical protein
MRAGHVVRRRAPPQRDRRRGTVALVSGVPACYLADSRICAAEFNSIMTQAIAGVAPPELGEVTIMTVWPSMAATGMGRMIGRLCGIQAGFGHILTIGNLLALALIPVALALFFRNLAPWNCRRYRLTNRRVLVDQGLHARAERFLDLDNFDTVEVVVLPGQEWFPAGDLVFRRGSLETLRLPGVLRPEPFRQTCLKAHRSYVAVKRAVALQSGEE